jgi:hypothetical protein
MVKLIIIYFCLFLFSIIFVYQMSIAKNDMKKIVANRRTKNEFNELTKNINMPNI